MGKWIERLFNEHKLVRRAVIFWSMGIITFIVVNRPEMQTGSFVSVVGVFATAIGLYQWDKMRDK